ncbi:hypothetical protein [Burkholderia cepacia]|uniref:hypothetical protein n=1 Tax=Burkholderia cepacia TaxID=292 RepID=UPI00158BE2EE|nr:hypothetical protein [Burkholderia cepacia]
MNKSHLPPSLVVAYRLPIGYDATDDDYRLALVPDDGSTSMTAASTRWMYFCPRRGVAMCSETFAPLLDDGAIPVTYFSRILMTKLSRLTACALILVATVANVTYARDLDKSDPDRAHILAAVHRLNDSEPDLKDYRYFVVDLIKDRDAAFACVALTDKDGSLEMTDDQVEIMKFALERRNAQWVATDLGGVGFADGAKPVQSDCKVEGRIVNTRDDVNVALKATGHKSLSTR